MTSYSPGEVTPLAGDSDDSGSGVAVAVAVGVALLAAGIGILWRIRRRGTVPTDL
ncbi:hypothetical protein AB0M47_12120 [Hamadaea sp. NPDC051192]|uniref:hypothetical protein n=1 Tax=Hamadaea sp. NPDC051192 TaxID=3154940 RepID=UPI00341617A4